MPGETWVLEHAWIQKHAKIITGVLVTSEQLPIHLNPELSSSRHLVTIGMGTGGKPQLPHVESWPQEHLPGLRQPAIFVGVPVLHDFLFN